MLDVYKALRKIFPSVDLHTAGKMGQKRTQMLLGPNKDRAVEGDILKPMR